MRAADASRRALRGVARGAVDLRHDRDAGLEAGQAERQLGEHQQGDGHDHQRVAVLGEERGAPVHPHVRRGQDVRRGDADHDDVEHEVGRDQPDGDPDRLGEPAQEDHAEQPEQDQRDDDLVTAEVRLEVRVLGEVRRRVGRGERHRDEEVGGREAQQHEDEELALPEGQQPLEHGDGALAVRALLRHAAVDGQRAQQGERDQDDRGDGAHGPGGEGRDAGLVAQRGEVVDAGQAHDPPPGVGLLGRVRCGVRARVAGRVLLGALHEPAAQPRGVRRGWVEDQHVLQQSTGPTRA